MSKELAITIIAGTLAAIGLYEAPNRLEVSPGLGMVAGFWLGVILSDIGRRIAAKKRRGQDQPALLLSSRSASSSPLG